MHHNHFQFKTLTLQVVAEYERSVIFRLGRLRKGKSVHSKFQHISGAKPTTSEFTTTTPELA
jgi:hypothetical protein